MSERWLTTDEAISAIQAHVAGSPGFASGLLKKARASGEVRWRNLDPVLLLADDGIVGMNLRHGAQRKHGVTADGEPVAYTFASSPGANGDKINEVDLLDWLTREKGPSRATPKAKGGRPRKYDVAAVEAEVMRLMEHHGEFSPDDPEWNAQARLVEAIIKKFGEAAVSTIEEYIRGPLERWRAQHPKT